MESDSLNRPSSEFEEELLIELCAGVHTFLCREFPLISSVLSQGALEGILSELLHSLKTLPLPLETSSSLGFFRGKIILEFSPPVADRKTSVVVSPPVQAGVSYDSPPIQIDLHENKKNFVITILRMIFAVMEQELEKLFQRVRDGVDTNDDLEFLEDLGGNDALINLFMEWYQTRTHGAVPGCMGSICDLVTDLSLKRGTSRYIVEQAKEIIRSSIVDLLKGFPSLFGIKDGEKPQIFASFEAVESERIQGSFVIHLLSGFIVNDECLQPEDNLPAELVAFFRMLFFEMKRLGMFDVEEKS